VRTEDPVNDLLRLAVKSHGGLQRWEQISRFRAPTAPRPGPVSIALEVANVTFS
jgi:hypothetical protein